MKTMKALQKRQFFPKAIQSVKNFDVKLNSLSINFKKEFQVLTFMALLVIPFLSVGQVDKLFDPAQKDKLPKFFGDEIYMELPDFEGTVNKEKGLKMLDEFYNSEKINAYKPLHDRSGRYRVGELKGHRGTFRLTYVLEKKILKEIQIRPNDRNK
jgi:hypothetical protein